VSVLGESLAGVSTRKKANRVPAMMEHAAAQRRRVSKARRVKKADDEVDFFCIGYEGSEVPRS
jgi:cytochrome c1